MTESRRLAMRLVAATHEHEAGASSLMAPAVEFYWLTLATVEARVEPANF